MPDYANVPGGGTSVRDSRFDSVPAQGVYAASIKVPFLRGLMEQLMTIPNVFVVAKRGGTFSSIEAACEAAGRKPASEVEPVIIWIMPGDYIVTNLVIPDWTIVQGVNEDSVTIIGNITVPSTGDLCSVKVGDGVNSYTINYKGISITV